MIRDLLCASLLLLFVVAAVVVVTLLRHAQHHQGHADVILYQFLTFGTARVTLSHKPWVRLEAQREQS